MFVTNAITRQVICQEVIEEFENGPKKVFVLAFRQMHLCRQRFPLTALLRLIYGFLGRCLVRLQIPPLFFIHTLRNILRKCSAPSQGKLPSAATLTFLATCLAALSFPAWKPRGTF